ncbi:MAG: hypothetical protein ACMUIS_08280 [bacterium]
MDTYVRRLKERRNPGRVKNGAAKRVAAKTAGTAMHQHGAWRVSTGLRRGTP